MRIRSIKPEFWRSADTAALDMFTRLLFIGLWNYVDDNGVGDDDVSLIRSDLFPRDPLGEELSLRIHGGLTELSRRAQITRYLDTKTGRRYLYVTNWHHQKINRPSRSNKPLPTSEDIEFTEDSVSPHGALTDDSLPDLGIKGSRDLGSEGARGSGGNARGTRLPDDWQPPADVVAQLRADHPHVDLDAELEKFRDYWTEQPGAKGRKTTWVGTYRNWIRRATEHSPRDVVPLNSQQTASTVDRKVSGWLDMAVRTPQARMELE